jgi:type II restriction enzyme
MNRNFTEWLGQFRFSISDYGYYVDFKKVIKNVKEKKVELNILNSLIGSKNIEQEFEDIIKRYPETLSCIPLLLAVREYEIFAKDQKGDFLYNFKKMNYSIEEYKYFMRETGLFDMLANHIVNNLTDYAYGVETGLDSNGRKNRGGHLMENLVESYIKKAGFQKGINYFKEMKAQDVKKLWNINLDALTNKGKTVKRFDFVVKTANKVYAIETNFYGGKGGGSKLNETARSYKMISEEAKSIPNFEFVWFTDGTAWNTARNNLEETFEVHPYIYNIKEMENDIMKELFI